MRCDFADSHFGLVRAVSGGAMPLSRKLPIAWYFQRTGTYRGCERMVSAYHRMPVLLFRVVVECADWKREKIYRV